MLSRFVSLEYCRICSNVAYITYSSDANVHNTEKSAKNEETLSVCKECVHAVRMRETKRKGCSFWTLNSVGLYYVLYTGTLGEWYCML
jgi:hypothetical protein